MWRPSNGLRDSELAPCVPTLPETTPRPRHKSGPRARVHAERGWEVLGAGQLRISGGFLIDFGAFDPKFRRYNLLPPPPRGTSGTERPGRLDGLSRARPRTQDGAGNRVMAPGRKTLFFVIFLLLGHLPVQGAPIDNAPLYKAPQETVKQQPQRSSLKEECPAGSYREPAGKCTGCREGVDYTNVPNTLPYCLRCKVCKSDEEELSPCTTTRDTECRCKPGTFRNDNSTEMCWKRPTGCHGDMVLDSNYTCINKSAVNSTEKTPAAEETTTTTLETPLALSLSVICIIAGCVLIICILLWVVFCYCFCSQRPETEDNAHNEILNNGDLQPTQVPEQEIEDQELAGLIHVTVRSPEEPQRLLVQAEAEGCQRKRLQVPVNDADPTEINALLDASAALEEGRAKETIQDQLVRAEKLLYEEGDAGSATSCL
nr:tumor necrosis factor receptor superfamily member 10D-like [Saimiri boliviensis boliviensis]